MPTNAINPVFVYSASPKPTSIFPRNLFFSSLARTNIFFAVSSSTPRLLAVNCSKSENSEQNINLNDALAGMVDDRVGEIFNREENRVLLDGLEKASQRVERARRELADIEKQELEAKQMRDYINLLENRASEIEECQKEILGAKAMVEEAERALSQNDGGFENVNSIAGSGSEEIDKDEERLESVKAAIVSALVGTLAGLPIAFTQVSSVSELVLPLGITFVSCALFGITFRYSIRRDLDNVHLKSGTPAAFGFVKGLATLGAGQPLELDTGNLISHALDGAIYVSQNLFVFLSAAVSLDYCFKMKLLSPFPIRKSFKDQV